ncbi:hypothetical protein ACVIHA_004698 [Bradyrhizobium liaoningense]
MTPNWVGVFHLTGGVVQMKLPIDVGTSERPGARIIRFYGKIVGSSWTLPAAVLIKNLASPLRRFRSLGKLCAEARTVLAVVTL